MIDNCHYHNYQLIQINHRLQDGVREMKRSPLNVVFNQRIELGIPQFSLPVLQLENKALVIVLNLSLRFLGAIKWYLRGALRTT